MQERSSQPQVWQMMSAAGSLETSEEMGSRKGIGEESIGKTMCQHIADFLSQAVTVSALATWVRPCMSACATDLICSGLAVVTRGLCENRNGAHVYMCHVVIFICRVIILY
jgi:hypothetical protein